MRPTTRSRPATPDRSPEVPAPGGAPRQAGGDQGGPGATVVLGSDWPIAPYPPLGVMAGSRHRRPSRDLTEPPHGIEQALTPLEALRGMTVNPARAAGEEGTAGRLAVGHRADLTVPADDPLTVPSTEPAELPALLTVADGRPTHRSPGL